MRRRFERNGIYAGFSSLFLISAVAGPAIGPGPAAANPDIARADDAQATALDGATGEDAVDGTRALS